MFEEYASSLFYPLYEGSVNEVLLLLLLLFLFVTNVKTHFIELYRIFFVWGEPTVDMFSILKCVYVVVLLSFQMKISMNIYI